MGICGCQISLGKLETKEYKLGYYHFQKMNVQKSNEPEHFATKLVKVILIIILLWLFTGILFPLPRHRGIKPRIKQAQMDMINLKAAISSYDTTYGHLPVADSDTNSDVTFGINSTDISGFQKIPAT